MTAPEAIKLGCWMGDVLDAFERIGMDWQRRVSVVGSCQFFFLNRYAEGYEPTGAAIAFADRYQQEYTR